MTRGSTLGLRDEPEEGAVTVEAPGPAVLDDFKAGLVMAVEKLVRHLAAGSLVRQLKCLGPEPLHADYRRQGVRASGRQGRFRERRRLAGDLGVSSVAIESAHFIPEAVTDEVLRVTCAACWEGAVKRR